MPDGILITVTLLNQEAVNINLIQIQFPTPIGGLRLLQSKLFFFVPQKELNSLIRRITVASNCNNCVCA